MGRGGVETTGHVGSLEHRCSCPPHEVLLITTWTSLCHPGMSGTGEDGRREVQAGSQVRLMNPWVPVSPGGRRTAHCPQFRPPLRAKESRTCERNLGLGRGGHSTLGSCGCGCGSSSGLTVSSEPSGANGPPGTRWLSCVCPTRHSARGVTGQGHCASEIVFSTLSRAFHSAVTQWAPCVQGAVPGEPRRRGCPRAPCLLSLQCSWGSKERDPGQS